MEFNGSMNRRWWRRFFLRYFPHLSQEPDGHVATRLHLWRDYEQNYTDVHQGTRKSRVSVFDFNNPIPPLSLPVKGKEKEKGSYGGMGKTEKEKRNMLYIQFIYTYLPDMYVNLYLYYFTSIIRCNRSKFRWHEDPKVYTNTWCIYIYSVLKINSSYPYFI